MGSQRVRLLWAIKHSLEAWNTISWSYFARSSWYPGTDWRSWFLFFFFYPIMLSQAGMYEWIPVCILWDRNQLARPLSGSRGAHSTVPAVKVEKWTISCHIRKQGGHSHRQFQLSTVSLRAFRKEENTSDLTTISLQPLPMVSPRERTMWITWDTGPG